VTDPLLLTFAVKGVPKSPDRPDAHDAPDALKPPFLFDIGSSLQPMSIRDQMFRAYALIERILAAQIIQPKQTDPILVVGGGIAGVMAAVSAVQHQVPVVLVEREKLFVRQIHSFGRFVCPTQYDWPAAHYLRGQYPLNGLKMPLSWKAGAAPEVLMAWNSQLNNAKGRADKLGLKTNFLDQRTATSFEGFQLLPEAGLVQIHLKSRKAPFNETFESFKVVIACAGFGAEKTWLPDDNSTYKGYDFWQTDPYEKEDLGLKNNKPARVIICGGGDGALQDFLRITTRSPAREIYRSLPDEVQQSIKERIYPVEDNAARCFIWTVGALDHPIHHQLQVEHQNVVNDLFESSKTAKPIRKALGNLIRDFNKQMTVKLVYPCDHFSNCYPLNRFLVLLVSKYLEMEFGMQQVLQPGTKVIDIQSAASTHQCEKSPSKCHGQDHELRGADADCFNFTTAGTDPAGLKPIAGGPYNAVIVRHGVEATKPPLGKRASANPSRQTIPYHTPW
jgi:hypothetical protein